jgi:hypothetical protein
MLNAVGVDYAGPGKISTKYHVLNRIRNFSAIEKWKTNSPFLSVIFMIAFFVAFVHDLCHLPAHLKDNQLGNMIIIHSPSKFNRTNMYNFANLEQLKFKEFLIKSLTCPKEMGHDFRVKNCYRLISFNKDVHVCCGIDSFFLSLHIHSMRLQYKETLQLLKIFNNSLTC